MNSLISVVFSHGSIVDLNRTTWSLRFLSHKLMEWGPFMKFYFFCHMTMSHPGLVLFDAVQLLIHVRLFATPWTAACQTSLSFTISQSLLKLISIDTIWPSLLLSSPSPPAFNLSQHPNKIFSNEFALHISRPKYWSLSFNISPSNEYSELISFRIDWFALLGVQGALICVVHHHSSKASVLQCSAFFMVQLWHPYITSGKTITLSIGTFVSKVMSLLFDTLSRFGILFFPWASIF